MWARVGDVAGKFGINDPRVKEYAKSMEVALNKLVADHGQVLSFAPSPDLEAMFPEKGKDMTPITDQTSPSTSVTSGSPETNFVPHDFKFLQVGFDVWTILEVWFNEKNL